MQVAALAIGGGALADAQSPTDVLQTEPHFFLIRDLDASQPSGYGSFLLRGRTGAGGFAHPDGVFLPSNKRLREWVLQPRTMRIAEAEYETPAVGGRFGLPEFNLGFFNLPDADNDGLASLAESIVGTNRNDPDTDIDGVADGAEVRNGTNPLDGIPATLGLLSAVDTPGTAYDVVAANRLAAVADRATGVILFDVSDALNPTRIAQVDTPGDATAVAFGTNLLGVADGNAGLAVVDITDPPAAVIRHQVALGANVRSVAVADALGFVGLDDGSVALLDLPAGFVLQRKKLGTVPIQDVALGDETLYAVTVGTLYAIDLRASELGAVTSAPSTAGVGAGGRRLRLAPAGDRIYATHRSGVNVFALPDPRAPALLRENTTPQFGWKQVVPNGSGLGLGAIGNNSTDDGLHDLDVLTLAPDGTATPTRTITTPGLAAGVAIFNGLAYVADSEAGLEVINYLAYDTQSQPPTIVLSAGFPLTPPGSAGVEEGQLARVTAVVTDDVQVRDVEFLIDGTPVTRDGGFPFDFRFISARRTVEKTSFTLQARAADTGGNTTATALYTIQLLPDVSPPRVLDINPADQTTLGPITTVLVRFNEPLDPATVTANDLSTRSLGPDRIEGSGDDVVLTPAAVTWRAATNTAALTFSTPLEAGVYRFRVVAGGVADLAGNAVTDEALNTFTIFAQSDRDRDGVPDELEVALGLDPDNPDSDGDGTANGLEDADGDGLTNSGEVLAGTNLQLADSDGDGINDGNEDDDGDRLTNKTEVLVGTFTNDPDTDNDGWNDEAEITGLGDPLSPTRQPALFFAGRNNAGIATVLRAATPGANSGVFVSRPAVIVAAPDASINTPIAAGSHVARPPVNVEVAP